MCNVAVRAYVYRKKKEKLLNRQHINRENRSTLTIKRPQTRTRSQLSERQRDFCTSQPWIWPHIVAPIYFCSRIPRCFCDRRNRWAQRTNAHMRHTPSLSANAYANARVFVRGSLKTRRFYLTKPLRTGQLTKGVNVTFENEADGRRDARYNIASTLPVNRALSRKHTVSERISELNDFNFSSTSDFFPKLFVIYLSSINLIQWHLTLKIIFLKVIFNVF